MKSPNETQAWNKIVIIKMTHGNLLENWDTLERLLARKNWIATKHSVQRKRNKRGGNDCKKSIKRTPETQKIAKTAIHSHEWVFTRVLYTFTTFSETTGWSNNGSLSLAVSSLLLLSCEDLSSLHVFFWVSYYIFSKRYFCLNKQRIGIFLFVNFVSKIQWFFFKRYEKAVVTLR